MQACVTSPPYYGLRTYGMPGEIGAEATPLEYVAVLADALDAVRRLLRDDGVLWLNLGDTYHGDSLPRRNMRAAFTDAWDPADSRGRGGLRRSAARCGPLKRKDLSLLPARVAMALQERGWWVRAEVVGAKTAVPPRGRVRDRPVRSHETLWLLTPRDRYKYRWQDAGSVWPVVPSSVDGHGAVIDPAMVDRCLALTADPGDVVLDPFCGSGNVGVAAARRGLSFVGIDLNPEHAALARRRVADAMTEVA